MGWCKSKVRRVDSTLLGALCFGIATPAFAQSTNEDRPIWERMEHGPYFSATVEAPRPEGNIAYKGLVVRLSGDPDRHVLFDTDLLRYAAGWTGGRINFRNIAYDGSHGTHSSIVGEQQFANPMQPGWSHRGHFHDSRELPYGPLPHDLARYRGLYVHGDRIVLEYSVGEATIRETPSAEIRDGHTLFARRIEIGRSPHDLTVQVCYASGQNAHVRSIDGSDRSDRHAPAADTLAVLRDPNANRTSTTPVGPATDGLLAHWPFDERRGRVVRNALADRWAGTVRGADWVAGHEGGGLAFDGEGSVRIEESGDIDLGESSFTITAWIRTDEGGSILSKAPPRGEWRPGGKSFFIRDGRLGFDIGWVGVVEGRRAVADGRWHHVAVTHEHRSHRIRLFVDGREDGTGRLEAADVLGHVVKIGYTATDFEPPFEGTIDDVRIYNRPLTADELARWLGESQKAGTTIARCVGAPESVEWQLDQPSHIRLSIPAAATPLRFKLVVGSAEAEKSPALAAAIARSPKPESLEPLTRPGPARYPQTLLTRGELATSDAPYVIDTITAPMQNPWDAWMRFGGFDFFADPSRAAICTWNGDVWIVEGIDERLDTLRWRRFATGLFQPLGLRILDDQIYVLGRDQITRLHDRDDDGEADFYENFNNDHEVTEHFHEFAMDLQTGPDGDFFYTKGGRHALDAVVPHHGTLLRVSRDGSTTQKVAYGYRAPNGLGIGPNGEFVVSDQQGHWTPANRINLVSPGGFYGYMWTLHEGERPTHYDPPICWMPQNVDRSPAEQLWVTSEKWGPLNGRLLSISYGMGHVFVVPYETVDGLPQGGVVRLPLDFPTGIMRGRFHPRDGQLYICGLFGWSSNKTVDGGFYRVRYTGRQVHVPVEVHALRTGVALTFTNALDRAVAEDVDNYHIEQWNYRWRQQYGSGQFKVSSPNEEGHDEVAIRSAHLLSDERTVFLRIDDLKPVMQMHIQYRLLAADGTSIRQELHNTINALGRPEGEMATLSRETSPIEVSAAKTTTPPDLVEGLLLRFRGPDGRQDTRRSRRAALHVPAGTSATPFFDPGPFETRLEGFVKADLKGVYTLYPYVRGDVTVRVNGRDVLHVTAETPSRGSPAHVALQNGYNAIDVRYKSPPAGDATFRLEWSSDTFAPEPIPTTHLFCNGGDEQLAQGNALRLGRELYATRGCANCHGPNIENRRNDAGMVELLQSAPSLAAAGDRFEAHWLRKWMLDPQSLRHDARMPRVWADPSEPAAQQAAADIAAFLTSLRTNENAGAEANGAADTIQGEALFENLGCIGCHTLDASGVGDPWNRVSLSNVSSKFRSGALKSFLREPNAFHAANRMPDFRLSPQEANALSAFLRNATKQTETQHSEVPAGDAARGQQLFVEVGCIHCHALSERENVDVSPPRMWTEGSPARDARWDRDHRPHYVFDDHERHALNRFLDQGLPSLARCAPVEYAHRQFRDLRCSTCHARDGQEAWLPRILHEESNLGLPPERLPDLTHAGEKLHIDWMRDLFSGEFEEPSRSWLRARMPTFATDAAALAAGLAASEGYAATSGDAFDDHDALVDAGRALIQKQGGFNCVQCHAIGEQPAEAPFEAPGVNLAHTTSRLRYDYYRRWMFDPLRIDPATKMPKLASEGGATPLRHVYGGDAARQFEAIWHYLQSLEP